MLIFKNDNMKYSLQFILAVVFFLSGSQIFAQENETDTDVEEKHHLLTDKFLFELGLYTPSKILKFGANGSSKNDIIEIDENLDLRHSQTTLFLHFNWRFARMWSVSAEYFGIKNVNSIKLNEDIIWEDIVYNAGTDVEVENKLRMYRVLFGRTITKGLKHEFGAGLGVHTLDINFFIEGEVFINAKVQETERRSVGVVAPLPNLGIWYFYAPNSTWMFTARLDWFGITIGDYSGSILNVGPGVNYQFHKNIGVNLKYRYFKFSARVDKSDWDGRFSTTFHGPLLTVNANF